MNDNRMALGEAIAAMRRHLQETMEEGGELAPLQIPPALDVLGDCFDLSLLERGILLLCAASELDATIPKLCDRLQGSQNMAYPTFSLAFEVFGQQSLEAMSSEGPLRFWRLLEVFGRDSRPAIACPLKIDDRILNFLTGFNGLDRRLADRFYPLGATEEAGELPTLAPSQEAIVAEICQVLARSQPGQPLPIVQLLGENAGCKQEIARKVAAIGRRSLYGLMGELIPASNAEYAEFMRLWEREEHLLALALYVDTREVTAEAALRRFLSQSRGLIFLDSRRVRLPSNREAVAIAADKPTPKEQRDAWETVLAGEAGDAPLRLASQFSLNFREIEKVAGSTSREERSLWHACLQRSAPSLESLAQRLAVKASWAHLVLPEEELGLLWQIVHQVRLRSRVYDEWGYRDRLNRGLGTAALFAGESGTGKTMAAEVIAHELDLHLYRIDLSSVVSKYIGETEKNLSRLFDAAEEGGAILFFDEADALFGKRSEVKDARDRYANLEIDYLLQRVESYGGLSIMATNMKGSLDTAFLRRLRFVIDFPFPEREYRQQMWEKEFPPQMPVGEMNFAHLSSFNLTGGAIHNIALNAAFLAAKEGEKLEMEHILAAVRSEWKKLGRPIYEAEFQWDGTEVDGKRVFSFTDRL
ncbi:MAG: ATP-binding protein [Spirulina sp.]